MDCSLCNFLVNGRLGPLHLGTSRKFVTDLLGPPPWWDGKPSHMYESDNWQYHSLQLLFSGRQEIEVIRIHFGATHEGQFTDGSLVLEPLYFSDTDPCSIAEEGAFIRYLGEMNIPIQRGFDRPSQPIVLTPRTVVIFRRIVHYEETKQAGRPILSDSYYLQAITCKSIDRMVATSDEP